jgi:hypothetical protein
MNVSLSDDIDEEVVEACFVGHHVICHW